MEEWLRRRRFMDMSDDDSIENRLEMLTEKKSTGEESTLEKLKIYTDRYTDRSKTYPTIKFLLRDTNKKHKNIEVLAPLFFNISGKYPILLYNLELNKNIMLYIKDLPDEDLFKNILILNKKSKEKNLITDITKIAEFKNYMKSHYFSNKLYDYYIQNLQKLIFFSTELFEKIIVIYIKEEKKTLLNTNTIEDLMNIDKTILNNITFLKSVLFDNFKNDTLILYSSKKKDAEYNNIYQATNSIIDTPYDRDSYMKNYKNALKLFSSNYSSDLKILGNFFILIKDDERIFGDFNSYLNFDIKEVALTVVSSAFVKTNCSVRKKNIVRYYGKVTGKKGGRKGGTRKKPKKISRKLKKRMKTKGSS